MSQITNEWEPDSVQDMIAQWATNIYMVVMFIFFPCFYRQNILQLIQDKKAFFLVCSIAYGLALCPALIKHMILFLREKEKPKVQMDTVFAGILFAAVIVSTLLAVDKQAAWSGISYRTVPANMMLLCLVTYFGVRTYGKYNTLNLWSWLIGSVVIYLFGNLCACKINFLNMQDNLGARDVFLTPLGNTNFNACYVCLVLPLVLVMYMVCKEKFSKNVYTVVMYMGFLFAMFIKTESSILAVLSALVILAYFALEKEEWFSRYLEILGIYILANTTIALLLTFFEEHLYPFDGVGAFLLKWQVLAVLWAAYGCLIAIFRFSQGGLRQKLCGIRTGVLIAGTVVIVVVVLGLLFLNTIGHSYAEAHGLQQLLLSDSSFSNRGIIWRNTIELIRQSSPLRLLFGNGLNTFKIVIGPIGNEEFLQHLGFYVQDPHNEILQAFTDMGLLGVVGYFGLLICSLVTAIRKWKQNDMLIVVVLSIAVYLIQGLVNCYALTHLPILFMFLGLANGDMRRNAGEE